MSQVWLVAGGEDAKVFLPQGGQVSIVAQIGIEGLDGLRCGMVAKYQVSPRTWRTRRRLPEMGYPVSFGSAAAQLLIQQAGIAVVVYRDTDVDTERNGQQIGGPSLAGVGGTSHVQCQLCAGPS